MVYGDLDISVLDELPPGRQKIETFLISPDKRQRAFGYVQKHLDQGRQGYLICPLIEEDDSGLQSVTQYGELVKEAFPTATVGVLHGKMKPAEKEQVMEAFSRGEVQLLVSTTVVEVGVDVSNAVIMVIEDADRYGLSQLHQLRGRIGRGQYKSTCILITGGAEPGHPQAAEAVPGHQRRLPNRRGGLEAAGPRGLLRPAAARPAPAENRGHDHGHGKCCARPNGAPGSCCSKTPWRSPPTGACGGKSAGLFEKAGGEEVVL